MKIAASGTVAKSLVAVLMLVAVYGVMGFAVAPRLVQQQLPGYLEQRLGRYVAIGGVSVNPFLLTVEIKGLVAAGTPDAPLLAVRRAFVDLSATGLFQRAWTFDLVEIDDPQVHAVIQRDGKMNLAEVARQWGRSGSQQQDAAQRLVVDALQLRGGTVIVNDFSDEESARTKIGPIRLHATDVTSYVNGGSRFELSARLPEGGSLSVNGELALADSTSSGQVRIRGFEAAAVWPFVRDELQLAQVQGTADVAARYDFQAEGRPMLRIDQLAFTVSDLSIARAGQEPMVQLDRIAASAGRFDSGERSVVLPRLELHDGALRALVGEGGELNWQQIAPDLPRAGPDASRRPPWQFQVEALRVENVAFHFEDPGRAEPVRLDVAQIDGSAALALTTGNANRVTVRDGDLDLHGIGLSGAGAEPVLSLDSAQIQGMSLDSNERHLDVRRIALEGGRAAIVREAGGAIAPLQLLGPGDGSSESTPGGGGEAGAADPWSYAIDAVHATGIALTLADRTFEPPVRYDAVLGPATVKAVKSDGSAAMPFEAALSVKQGGRLSVRGTVEANAGAVDARVSIDGLTLAPLQPVVAQFADVAVQSAALSSSTEVHYQRDDNTLRIGGSGSLADVLIIEPGSERRLVAWKQVSVQGLKWNSRENRLAIDEVSANEPQLRIVISEDRQLNLAQVWSSEQRKTDGPAPPAPGDRQASAARPLQVYVGEIRLRGGLVDFADHSLVLPFSRRVTAVNGTISGVTTDLARHAQVSARGDVEPYGSATVEGSVEIFEPTRHMDLHVVFSNLALPPLSPYTATFAGRKVESGTLWLDLNYRISQGDLLGKNDIRIENFTLGERVEADALDVPLDLIVALLKDASGRISLSVPVTGDFDNPRFSIAAAVRSAIGNFVQRLATAPFKALARVFGATDDEALAQIEFAPGSARLRPEARQRLERIARALRERPLLQLTVLGPYDPEVDEHALRREQLRRHLARVLNRTVAPDEDPGPINADDPRTQSEIESMLAARAGHDEVAALKRQHANDPRAPYRAMVERLVELYPLPDGAAPILAARRAEAIARYLAQSGDINRDRIESGRVRAVEAGRKNLISAILGVDVVDAAS